MSNATVEVFLSFQYTFAETARSDQWNKKMMFLSSFIVKIFQMLTNGLTAR